MISPEWRPSRAPVREIDRLVAEWREVDLAVARSRAAERSFREEIAATRRYERGLLAKAAACLLLAALVGLLRELFLI